MEAQLMYCDVAFKRANLSLSLWVISGPRCNCLILTCPKDSSHRKKGFLLETPIKVGLKQRIVSFSIIIMSALLENAP